MAEKFASDMYMEAVGSKEAKQEALLTEIERLREECERLRQENKQILKQQAATRSRAMPF